MLGLPKADSERRVRQLLGHDSTAHTVGGSVLIQNVRDLPMAKKADADGVYEFEDGSRVRVNKGDVMPEGGKFTKGVPAVENRAKRRESSGFEGRIADEGRERDPRSRSKRAADAKHDDALKDQPKWFQNLQAKSEETLPLPNEKETEKQYTERMTAPDEQAATTQSGPAESTSSGPSDTATTAVEVTDGSAIGPITQPV